MTMMDPYGCTIAKCTMPWKPTVRRTPSPSSNDEESMVDQSELPLPHVDDASVVSSVAPSAGS